MFALDAVVLFQQKNAWVPMLPILVGKVDAIYFYYCNEGLRKVSTKLVTEQDVEAKWW
jgi:hypothetical protein